MFRAEAPETVRAGGGRLTPEGHEGWSTVWGLDLAGLLGARMASEEGRSVSSGVSMGRAFPPQPTKRSEGAS